MTADTRIGIVTIVRGRHHHLEAHLAAIRRSERPADVHVVVAMADAVAADLARGARSANTVVVREVDVPADGELPLAQARNVGADAAIKAGCELLVFLDVDCLVSRAGIGRYEQSWRRVRDRHDAPVLLSGPVAYLPPLSPGSTYPLDGLDGLARPHPARPAPRPGRLEAASDLRLFWSLSFAMGADDWRSVGGFTPDYRGYGGEDTDFAMHVAQQQGVMYWVGGADAFHQHHPVESPPVRHLASIVRNANQFHRRWGWFPMEGWLDDFEGLGLARHDAGADRWVVVADEPAVVAHVGLDHPVDREA